MMYDSAKAHRESKEFLDNLSSEYSHTHIGMYLGWIIQRHLYSKDFEDEAVLQIRYFEDHSISCGILSELWCGELHDDMFSEEGNAFTQAYYARYLDDYCSLFPEHDCVYLVEDTRENFNKVAKLLDMRFEEWQKSKS